MRTKSHGQAGASVLAVVLISAALIALAAFWQANRQGETESASQDSAETVSEAVEQPYLRAAHWFGDAWPVNMWNTDLETRARQDFEKILDDGFNTVVLLVPWPGFAPDPRSGQLDEDRTRRLTDLMRLADSMGLKTVLRISYAWDGVDDVAGTRMLDLWLDPTYYAGWLDYVEALWLAVHDIPGFQFGFFSWEDLWAATSLVERGASERRLAAQSSGFADWLLRDADPKARATRAGPDTIEIPSRREPAFEQFIEFVSQAWVERFFVPAQARFPRLSMEIRLDSDPIFDGEELIGWFHHHGSWNLPGADWVTLYWSPSMGGENQGGELSPEEAASRLDDWLEQVAHHAGPRHIFIGQFLAEDFTPGYELNDRLPRDQVGEFLARAASVLQARSAGVGLWTWTDYGHDLFGNPEFSNGLEGWQGSESGLQVTDPGLSMDSDAWLSFSGGRWMYHAPGGPEQAELCVRARPVGESDAVLRLYQASADGAWLPLSDFVFGPAGDVQCVDHQTASLNFRWVAEAPLRLERVNSIGFVQKSGMRETDFSLKPVGEHYRALNAHLNQRALLERPRFEDGWTGQFWRERLAIEGGNQAVLVLESHQPPDWPLDVDLTVALDGETVGQVSCEHGARHEFMLAPSNSGFVDVFVEASDTHRPGADQRDLGCLLTWSIGRWSPGGQSDGDPSHGELSGGVESSRL